MAWTTLSFPFGSILTSTKMTQLYDNLTALANGDPGAPPIIPGALLAGALGRAMVGPDRTFATTNTASFVSQETHYIYIPSTAQTLYYACEITASLPTTDPAEARLLSSSATGTSATSTTASYVLSTGSIDVSGDSGWTAFTIQILASIDSGSCTVRGFYAYLT